MTTQRFHYKALGANGETLSDIVVAPNRAEAFRRLQSERKTVLELRGEEDAARNTTSKPRVSQREMLLVLQQMAVLLRARIELLETLEIITGSFPGRPIAACLRATANGLRRGDRLAKALGENAPFLPAYVIALIQAGESSGRLALVLEESARQMAFEQRVGKDVGNALIYPLFLVASGAASVGFLFYVVVPRFADMLHSARAELSGLSAFVINTGVAFHANAPWVIAAMALLVFAAVALARMPETKRLLSQVGHATPGLQVLLVTRQRAAWSRIMSIALAAGVDVMAATMLAAGALPEGSLKHQAQAAIASLRAGRPVDEAFLKSNTLSIVDASLIRAGQRSGALSEMFRAVADRNDEDMRDALKRFTLAVEPLAIGIVASMIGAIVIGLVSALASIYDSIG